MRPLHGKSAGSIAPAVSIRYFREQTSHFPMQQHICLFHKTAAMEKAMMASEPEVEPNWSNTPSPPGPVTTCDWYTPTSAATAAMNSRIARTHFVTTHPKEQEVCCCFLSKAIGNMGKDWRECMTNRNERHLREVVRDDRTEGLNEEIR